MNTGAAIFLAVICTLVITIGAAYVWYNYNGGWTKFNYSTGDLPSWTPAKDADISRLRFKDCIFTVTVPAGDSSPSITKTANAAPALNAMALGFKGGVSNPASLKLVRPLNPFSFHIKGFNDKAVADDQNSWVAKLQSKLCTADSDCPFSKQAGACAPCPGGCDRYCVNTTDDGPVVTLIGLWRTI